MERKGYKTITVCCLPSGLVCQSYSYPMLFATHITNKSCVVFLTCTALTTRDIKGGR